MNSEPPLLIIAPTAHRFDLAHLPWLEVASARISVNHTKFPELEMVEVIVDAMPFLLSRLTAAETGQRFAGERFERLFCDPPAPGDSAIAVAPGDILTSARHLPEINRRMLILGKWIGECVGATAAAWLPSRKLAGFGYFDEAVGEYLIGGPFPVLFQTSFSEVGKLQFVTRGLAYFAGQEIRLTAPPDYTTPDAINHLARIIDDIATRGKIVSPARSAGLVDSETLDFSPADDRAFVDIAIEKSAINIG